MQCTHNKHVDAYVTLLIMEGTPIPPPLPRERRRRPQHRSEVPDTLYDEDVEALNDVRRNVWRGGAQGGLYGATGSLGGLVLARRFRTTPPITSAHLIFGTLLGAAAGSFLGSVTAGKNSRWMLQNVFSRGASGTAYTETTRSAAEDAQRQSHERRLAQIRAERQQPGEQQGFAHGVVTLRDLESADAAREFEVAHFVDDGQHTSGTGTDNFR